MNDQLAVLDAALRERGLDVPTSARGLVMLVHLDSSSEQRSGQRFIADVLRANGLATLTVTLHPAVEQHAGLPPPGQVQVRRRLRAVFEWLAPQLRIRPLPLALMAVDDAVRGSVAAAAARAPTGLHSLILLDGRAYHVSHLLARLSLPTLMIVGACSPRALNRHRSALRQMTAPAHLEALALATHPRPAAGAHQAAAHAAVQWLEATLWPPAAGSAGAPNAPGPRLARKRVAAPSA